MKPLFHPAPNNITIEGIMHAFSDPVRVRIYAEIAQSECPQICSTFLGVGDNALPKSTLSQHFRILREAGLIRSTRKGVELHNVTRCAELKERFGVLIPTIIEAYAQQHKKTKPKKR